MNNYNIIQDTHEEDNSSVFTFSVALKKKNVEDSPSPSDVTNINSNSDCKYKSNFDNLDSSLVSSDDILSMIDFLIDAHDFDSQLDPVTSLFSNNSELSSLNPVKLGNRENISAGINLMELKRARNLLNFKFRRFHRTSPLALKKVIDNHSGSIKPSIGVKRKIKKYGSHTEFENFRESSFN